MSRHLASIGLNRLNQVVDALNTKPAHSFGMANLATLQFIEHFN
jgi:hypothetical protein